MTYRKRAAELLEQGHFNDRPSRLLNLFLIALITLNIIAIIFESVDWMYLGFRDAFRAFEVFSVAVFTVEYVARVWCSVDLVEHDDSSPIKGRLRYMLSPLAIVDLVAILPFYLSLFIPLDLRFLRAVRLLRLFKLTRYSPAMGALLDVIQQEAEALLASIVVLVMMLVMAAAGIYLLEHELQPEAFSSIPSAMWWAMVTLTTVGYGDVIPVTTGGRIFGGIIGLIGIGMIALPAAILASGFAENIHERRKKYTESIHDLLADGVLDADDLSQLEGLRRELGLRSNEALQLLQRMMRQARDDASAKCPHCGKPLHAPRHD